MAACVATALANLSRQKGFVGDALETAGKDASHIMTIYSHDPQHRNQTPGKSQWSISRQDESACFAVAHSMGWIDGEKGWGLHCLNGALQYLGFGQDHTTRVFMAKFVGHQDTWHGYPADHQRNQQDIPSEPVRKIWLHDGVLTAPKIRKITKGQPCRL